MSDESYVFMKDNFQEPENTVEKALAKLYPPHPLSSPNTTIVIPEHRAESMPVYGQNKLFYRFS